MLVGSSLWGMGQERVGAVRGGHAMFSHMFTFCPLRSAHSHGGTPTHRHHTLHTHPRTHPPTHPPTHVHAPPEDERYLVKTMRKSEMKVLLEMLPKYYEHVTKYPQTLITRFFGLHRVTPTHAGSSVSVGYSWLLQRRSAQLDS